MSIRFTQSKLGQGLVRLSVIMLTFVLIFSSSLVIWNAEAATYREKEPNDSIGSATAMTLNVDYTGSFTASYNDYDYYKITLPEDGYISFEMTHAYLDYYGGAYLTVIGSNQTTEIFNRDFVYKTNLKQKTDSIGLAKGTYYVRLRGDEDIKSYTFRTVYTKSSVWEKEINDSIGSANSIKVNTKYYAGTRHWNDEDWYKVTINSPGYISVNFQHKYIDSDNYYVKIIGSNQSTVLYENSFSAKTNQGDSTPNIGVPKGTYYISIEGVEKYAYNFTVNYKASNYWETEINDTIGMADSVKVNTTYNGSSRNSYDEDYYKFTISKAGPVSITLKHPYIDSGNYYVKIIGGDQSTQYYSGSFSGQTNTATTSTRIGLPKGTYYLYIENTGSQKNYTFKINHKASSVWETEINNNMSVADSIKLGTKYYGSGSPGDYYDDWYKFKLTQKDKISITYSGASSIHVYKSDGSSSVLYDYLSGSGSKTTETISLPKGTYYLDVYPNNGVEYNFTINAASLKAKTTIRRLYGNDRFGTAYKISEAYIKDSKQSQLNNVIVVNGTNKSFPDALSATYLSAKYKAPIILTDNGTTQNNAVVNWVKKNMRKGKGNVYFVGGKLVLSESLKTQFKKAGYTVKRVAGNDRIGTNIASLKNVGVKNGSEMLVSDGWDPYTSLIASATGKPVLLVQKGGLTKEQKSFLKNKNLKFTLIGDTGKVSSTVESNLKSYGTIKQRIKAGNLDSLSVAVAKKYWPNGPSEVFLARSETTFADSLSGGSECIYFKGPLLLVSEESYSASKKYVNGLYTVKRITVFGGPLAISDKLAKSIKG